jgi:hydrophobic/amphiphilic exporter-1 (mainly G- bacteria), HAE1 family
MIRFFAGHRNAANLVMILMLVLGAVSVPTIVRSTFPPLPLNTIEVRVVYPGAAAQRVEEAICRRLEEAIDRVTGVSELACASEENVAIARVEAGEGVSIERFMSDVKAEVDTIDGFPATAEPPIVRLLGLSEPVASVAAYGDLPYPELHRYAEQLKEDLKRVPGVSQVRIRGFSDPKLRVELDRAAMQGLGLSVVDVMNAVRSGSLELPGGDIDAPQGSLAVRLDDERRTPDELAALVVAAVPGGGEVRLGDIARIVRTFQHPDQRITFDGKPAAILSIEKNRSEDALSILAGVRAFIEVERTRNVGGIQLALTQNVATLVSDRLSMLVRNGLQGLVLVMLTLWLFFSARHAFWVGMGLPVSFAGCFALMSWFGLSFDMLSLVALLIAVGILVDDAIVVSENIAAHRERGKDPVTASVDGAREVLPSVFASFATTLCIFAPLAFLSGDMGAILKVVPIVLLITLAVSFIEAFLILPAHLRHTRFEHGRGRVQSVAQERLALFRDRHLARWLRAVVAWRYLAFGSLFGAVLITASLAATGIVGFTPLPELDTESIEARILLPQGTPAARTEAVVARVLDALAKIDAELSPLQPDGQRLVRHVAVHYGRNVDAFESGSHVATVTVDLLSPEVRTVTSSELRGLWRQRVGQLPDVIAISYTDPQIGPHGKPLDLRVAGQDLERLRIAAEEIRDWLSGYRGVDDVATDLRPGKRELNVRIRPGARAFGVDGASIANQLRGSFFGLTATEVRAGLEQFDVDVRFAEAERGTLDTLDGFMVRTTNGSFVPLSAVADVEEARSYARINRIDGRRVVTVFGGIDHQQTTSAAVLADISANFLPGWHARYPDLVLGVDGETAQAEITIASMLRGLALGLVGIYLLLAFLFRSYVEPLVVLVIVPASYVGVVLGHILLGYNLTMPSLLGLISLAGIVVNNAILLVAFVDKRLETGVSLADAAVQAALDRFRPVLLTSATTVMGLLPLLLETSMQAKVVIPLAISLAFGLTTATVAVLFVVPAFYLVLQDFGLFRRAVSLAPADPIGPRGAAV